MGSLWMPCANEQVLHKALLARVSRHHLLRRLHRSLLVDGMRSGVGTSPAGLHA